MNGAQQCMANILFVPFYQKLFKYCRSVSLRQSMFSPPLFFLLSFYCIIQFRIFRFKKHCMNYNNNIIQRLLIASIELWQTKLKLIETLSKCIETRWLAGIQKKYSLAIKRFMTIYHQHRGQLCV